MENENDGKDNVLTTQDDPKVDEKDKGTGNKPEEKPPVVEKSSNTEVKSQEPKEKPKTKLQQVKDSENVAMSGKDDPNAPPSWPELKSALRRLATRALPDTEINILVQSFPKIFGE